MAGGKAYNGYCMNFEPVYVLLSKKNITSQNMIVC